MRGALPCQRRAVVAARTVSCPGGYPKPWTATEPCAASGRAMHATATKSAARETRCAIPLIMGSLRAFPSIVMWVTNNEGWGQYDSATLGALAKGMDPSRLVNSASGWFDFPGNNSDVYDIHTYEEVPIAPERSKRSEQQMNRDPHVADVENPDDGRAQRFPWMPQAPSHALRQAARGEPCRQPDAVDTR